MAAATAEAGPTGPSAAGQSSTDSSAESAAPLTRWRPTFRCGERVRGGGARGAGEECKRPAIPGPAEPSLSLPASKGCGGTVSGNDLSALPLTTGPPSPQTPPCPSLAARFLLNMLGDAFGGGDRGCGVDKERPTPNPGSHGRAVSDAVAAGSGGGLSTNVTGTSDLSTGNSGPGPRRALFAAGARRLDGLLCPRSTSASLCKRARPGLVAMMLARVRPASASS